LSPGGRPSEGKAKVNLTLTPEVMREARKIDSNLSRLVESLLKKEIKRHRHNSATRTKTGNGK
jgi:post-segregation antitoxin (ccd killing protein)